MREGIEWVYGFDWCSMTEETRRPLLGHTQTSPENDWRHNLKSWTSKEAFTSTEERKIGEILSRSSDTVTDPSSASCIPTCTTAIPIPNNSYPSQPRSRMKQKISRNGEIREREAQTRMCFFQFQLVFLR